MEIVLLIVLIAIFAAVLKFANKDDDRLHLATLQVLEHIRYTQHLAMSDNKFDPKDNTYNLHINKKGPNGRWFYSRWQIWFRQNSKHMLYVIFSDKNRGGNFDYVPTLETARDPLTGEVMAHRLPTEIGYKNENEYNNENFDLTAKYGIVDIATKNCNQESISPSKARIVFDEKGRPYGGISALDNKNAYFFRITKECDITFTADTGKTATIRIYPESGYAEILNIEQ